MLRRKWNNGEITDVITAFIRDTERQGLIIVLLLKEKGELHQVSYKRDKPQ